MIRHPTHKTSIQVLFMATVLFLLTLQDGTTICLHCDLQVVHISCSFLCLFYVNVLFQINANNILRPSCYCILYSWIPTTWIRLSIYHSDTDPERTRAPAARDRPGGSSTPTLLLCSYPRRGLATLARSELGELLRPEQIHRCVLAIPQQSNVRVPFLIVKLEDWKFCSQSL